MTYDDLRGLMTRMTGDEKHSASATSTLDIVWVLYDRVLHIDPDSPAAKDRDRFFLSKGHGPMAYFAVLAAKGFFPAELLDNFASFDSPLGHHPDATLIPGVEISSGSLGHGLPMAVGSALALRSQKSTVDTGAGIAAEPASPEVQGRRPPTPRPPHVFCLLGDAELEEGSNHEAIALAGRLGLGSLTAIVVDNRSSTLGWPGGIGLRFASEGWESRTVNGHDHATLESALQIPSQPPPAPRVVVAQVDHKEGES